MTRRGVCSCSEMRDLRFGSWGHLRATDSRLTMGWALCASPVVRVPTVVVVVAASSPAHVPKKARSAPQPPAKAKRVVMDASYSTALLTHGRRDLACGPGSEQTRRTDFVDLVGAVLGLAAKESTRLAALPPLRCPDANANRLKSAEPERAVKKVLETYTEMVVRFNLNLPAVVAQAAKPTPYPKQPKDGAPLLAGEFVCWAKNALAPKTAAATKAKAGRLRSAEEAQSSAAAEARAAGELAERRPAVVARAATRLAAAHAHCASSGASQSAATFEACWQTVQSSVTEVVELGASGDAQLLQRLEAAASELAKTTGEASSSWAVSTGGKRLSEPEQQCQQVFTEAVAVLRGASATSSRRCRNKQAVPNLLSKITGYTHTSLLGVWEEKTGTFTLRVAGMTAPSRDTAEGICAMMTEPPPRPCTFVVVHDSTSAELTRYHLGDPPGGGSTRQPRATAAPTAPSAPAAPAARVAVASPPTVVGAFTESVRGIQAYACAWLGWG